MYSTYTPILITPRYTLARRVAFHRSALQLVRPPQTARAVAPHCTPPPTKGVFAMYEAGTPYRRVGRVGEGIFECACVEHLLLLYVEKATPAGPASMRGMFSVCCFVLSQQLTRVTD